MGTHDPMNPLSRGAEWLAARDGLPLPLRAVLGYYGDEGVLDYQALKIKSYVDDEIDDIVDAAYTTIEQELANEFDVDEVEFEYDTKLTLPAELTLGYLYRRIMDESPAEYNPITRTTNTGLSEYIRVIFDTKRRRRNQRLTGTNRELVERVEEIERTTALIVEAVIDGDMRDALNDEEYTDFNVNVTIPSEAEKRRVAEIAQRTLQDSIEERLSEFPDAVNDAYRGAVEISERHQDEDEAFRELMNREDRAEAIRERYKFETFESSPELFDQDVLDLPYFKTQYDRVGVIYDGMIDMYRGAGFDINDDFKRSIVLAIIGAQIWLDDVADYYDDREEGQLTPVTAEYMLADSDPEAYHAVIDIAETYLDHAKRFATDSGTPMTGIAVEYVYRMGKPDHLPH